MKLLLLSLTIFLSTYSCGDDTDSTVDKDRTFALQKGDSTEKEWGDGGIILNEENLVIYTSYIPEAVEGAVSLPTCANLDPEMVVGKFICNTDDSVQEIKAKHTKRICSSFASEDNTIEADDSLSMKNCMSGKITYFPLNVKLGYAIQDK